MSLWSLLQALILKGTLLQRKKIWSLAVPLQSGSTVFFYVSSRKRKTFKERVNFACKALAEIKVGGGAGSAVAVPYFLFLSVAQQPNSDQGRLIVELFRSHTISHTHAH